MTPRKPWWRIGIGLVVAALLGAGVSAWWLSNRINRLERLTRTISAQRLGAYTEPTDELLDSLDNLPLAGMPPATQFEAAAQRSVDAVVFIHTEIGDPGYVNDLMHVPSHSNGSGVIVQPEGYIVTNRHVIQDARTITVTLNNYTEYEAELIAADPNTDLAVLKIDETGLPTLPFADSDQVPVGRWVLAVGNPFNLASTVTTGIVSAKARNIGILRNELPGEGNFAIESFIQTDAAVNPGNSGGALVNLQGELIGINTAIASETGSYQGYSFAIPSNLVRKVVADLIQFGVVQRGFLGVGIRDIDSELFATQSLATRRGAYILALTSRGAAETAGLRVGDIIISLNGKPISSASALQEQVGNYRPNDTVALRVLRSRDTLAVDLVLRNAEGGLGLLNSPNASGPARVSVHGLTLRLPTASERSSYGVGFGVLVKRVAPGSLWATQGLHPNVLLTHVNRTPIRGLDQARQLMAQGGQRLYLEGRAPAGGAVFFLVNLPLELGSAS